MGFTVTIVDPRSFEFRVCFHVDLVLGHCCSVPSLWHPGPSFDRSRTRTIVRACLHSGAPPCTRPCVVPLPLWHPGPSFDRSLSGTRDHRPSLPAFRRPTVHLPMRCSVPSLWHPGPSSEPACIPTLGPRPLAADPPPSFGHPGSRVVQRG